MSAYTSLRFAIIVRYPVMVSAEFLAMLALVPKPIVLLCKHTQLTIEGESKMAACLLLSSYKNDQQ